MNRNMWLILLIIVLLIETKLPYVVLKILNKDLTPVRNKKIKIIGCNRTINAVTDSNGLVKLNNIEYGKYRVEILSDKYILITNFVDIFSLGIYKLIVIENVYSEISGTAYDKESNIPIGQSIIILFKKEKNTNKYIPFKKTTTDFKGNYSFKYIPCGNYYIKGVV